MALPSTLASTTPVGGNLPSTLDDQIRALKLAIEDIFGIPDATAIAAAGCEYVAAGLKNVRFQDAAANPATAGYLQRNAADLLFYDGTAARTLVSTAATQTLTNKTLTAPTISAPVITGLTPTVGGFTRDVSTASGTSTFAHGGSVAPKAVAFVSSSDGALINVAAASSVGFAVVGGAAYMTYVRADAITGRQLATDAVGGFVDASNHQVGRPTSADATNVTMTWTKTGTPTGNIAVTWIAFF